jgi:hypothetical protein
MQSVFQARPGLRMESQLLLAEREAYGAPTWTQISSPPVLPVRT